MYKNKTDEFSFVIKPSKHGVGVFAAHGIRSGTYLRLFHEENEESVGVERKKKYVPEYFRQYCLDRGDKYYAMRDIAKDEEITIDYNSLEEPEDAKADYYR